MDILQTVGSLSPMAVIGLLSYVVYVMVQTKKGQDQIANNHLHEMPEVAQNLREIKVLLQKMNDGIVTLLARK